MVCHLPWCMHCAIQLNVCTMCIDCVFCNYITISRDVGVCFLFMMFRYIVIVTWNGLRKLNAPINASMWSHVVFNSVVVRRRTWRLWTNTAGDLQEDNQRDPLFLEKLVIVQCKGEMVSFLNWITSTASLMTKKRPGRRNTFNAIHKHFYRTSNPWVL